MLILAGNFVSLIRAKLRKRKTLISFFAGIVLEKRHLYALIIMDKNEREIPVQGRLSGLWFLRQRGICFLSFTAAFKNHDALSSRTWYFCFIGMMLSVCSLHLICFCYFLCFISLNFKRSDVSFSAVIIPSGMKADRRYSFSLFLSFVFIFLFNLLFYFFCWCLQNLQICYFLFIWWFFTALFMPFNDPS